MAWCDIYCHTNKINGKKYVGQSWAGMMTRWKAHVWHALNPSLTDRLRRLHFARAIRKYGPDVFEHELLDRVSTQDGADRAERAWIEHLNTLAPNGYNLKAGGATAPLSAESKNRLSETLRRVLAAVPVEIRRERAKRAHDAVSPEYREEKARRLTAIFKALPPERRSEISRRNYAVMSPEKRAEKLARYKETMTPEKRSVAMKKGWANTTPETTKRRVEKRLKSTAPMSQEERPRRSERLKAEWAALSPEERNARAARARVGLTPEVVKRRGEACAAAAKKRVKKPKE
jgi:group I intron endonuclease